MVPACCLQMGKLRPREAGQLFRTTQHLVMSHPDPPVQGFWAWSSPGRRMGGRGPGCRRSSACREPWTMQPGVLVMCKSD